MAVAAACMACGSRGTSDERVTCGPWSGRAEASVRSAPMPFVSAARSVFIARDGTHLVYRTGDGGIMAHRIATGEEREVVVADDVSLFPQAIDASTFVAFTTRAMDNYQEYFTVDVEACRSRTLPLRVSTADVAIGYSLMAALSLDGDRLYYAISRGTLADAEAFVVDLPSLRVTTLGTSVHSIYEAKADGERVAWLQRATGGSSAVGAWSATDGAVQTFPLPALANPTQLAFSGGRAVWTDHRDVSGLHNEHVYLLDLATGEARPVTDGSSRQYQPTILGNLVAWADNRSGNFDIRLLDLGTGQEREFAATAQDESSPVLTDAGLFWIVWQRDGTGTVYLEPTVRP